MDITCIVFVRGKIPDSTTIDLAIERNIPVLSTSRKMFEACGILYSKGLSGGKEN